MGSDNNEKIFEITALQWISFTPLWQTTAARMSGEDVPYPAGWLPILGHWLVIKKYMKEKQNW